MNVDRDFTDDQFLDLSSDEKTIVIIDGPQFKRMTQSLEMEVDFKLLYNFFDENYDLREAIFVMPWENRLEATAYNALRPLADFLEFNNYTVKKVETNQVISKGAKTIHTANLTAVITMLMIQAAVDRVQPIEHLVLFVTAPDYAPVIEYIVRKGIKVTIYGTTGSSKAVHDSLRKAANRFISVKEIKEIIRKPTVPNTKPTALSDAKLAELKIASPGFMNFEEGLEDESLEPVNFD